MNYDLDTISKQASSLSSTTNELIDRYKVLDKFDDAAIWFNDVKAVATLFEQYKEVLLQFIVKQKQILSDLEDSRSAQPLLKRFFTSTKDEKRIGADIAKAETGIDSVDSAAETLNELLDTTPLNKEEQAGMLKELREAKKDLTLEKRTVNAQMHSIRTQMRQENTSIAGQRGPGSRYYRAAIVREKEKLLNPHEDSKAAIEQELIIIEKRINRISRFTGDNSQPQFIDIVFRCAYCGRRVQLSAVCPGCGSALRDYNGETKTSNNLGYRAEEQ